MFLAYEILEMKEEKKTEEVYAYVHWCGGIFRTLTLRALESETGQLFVCCAPFLTINKIALS